MYKSACTHAVVIYIISYDVQVMANWQLVKVKRFLDKKCSPTVKHFELIYVSNIRTGRK